MRFGIGTYTFPWAVGNRKHALPDNQLPIPALLEKAGQLPGVEVVQLCDHSFPERLSKAERAALRARAAELGITLQVGTKGIEPERLALFLELAIDVDADLVRTILPMSGPGSAYGEARAILAESLPAYEAKGIRLALENHDKNLSADLRRFVEDVGSPVFGICLDTVNSYGIGEDSRRVLDLLVPVTTCFHAKDYAVNRVDYGLGFVIQGTPTGSGMLDLPDIVARFAKAGIAPDIIVEQWTPWQGEICITLALEETWSRQSCAYLNKLLHQG